MGETKNKENICIALIALFNVDLGIRYISSFLEKNGFYTYVFLFGQLRYKIEFLNNNYFTTSPFDHNIYFEKNLYLLIETLSELKPNLVGISVTSVTARLAQKITFEIKKYIDTIVVWGGIHATLVPEECIRYADIVCVGEGEIPMCELSERIRKGQQLSGIKNLWIRNGNEIEKNELRPLIENLDDLPFPDFIKKGNKFLIDNGKLVEDPPLISAYNKGTYPIITSRGCMFNCSFCCNNTLREVYKGKGRYLRRRSVDNVIQELRAAIENMPVNRIRFWDDIFIYDNEWIDEFSIKYLRYIGKQFICYNHFMTTDKNLLIKLRKFGLISVFTGIQSGSDVVNKEIFFREQKGQDILNFANFILKLKIFPWYDLIIDNPYESDRDNDETVELLLRLPRPYIIQLFSLSYFPKTVLTKKALDDGIISLNEQEQYSSKSLNNFFMFLPFSKNKDLFFWNCIKAMSINKYFPKKLVRLCKCSIFFRKYPKILFILAKTYINIINIFKILKDILIFLIFKNRSIKNKSLIYSGARILFRKESVYSLFFPLNNEQKAKIFCLKITNKLERDLFINLSVKIRPFSEHCYIKSSEWKIKLKLKSSSQSNIILKLIFPYLYYSLNETGGKLKMSKKGSPKLEKDKLYIIKAEGLLYSKTFSIKSSYINLGYVLFNI